ncbi:hypothetical protein ABT061_32680 [Streptosporangium sp. NPDC002544]|uniref:hypothetical protein n=1 Tax=Streptosporangium sp. NPDC002544 TaxID=3154538 RepID=UPI00331EF14E
MFDWMDMPNPTHLYDLLESRWENIANGFAAVWAEGLTVEETARRLGADPGSATALTLEDIGLGFEGDEMPGDEDGIILVGPCDAWTLAVQIQWMDVTEEPRLSELSRDGGRAIAIGWHGDGAHRVEYAIDGRLTFSAPLEEILDPLHEHAEGLRMPTDWDVPVDVGSPTEEMITAALTAIGRLTGRELDEEWLETPHVRYLIRRTR